MADAEGVSDGAWFGRVGMFWAFRVEGRNAAFDDAGVAAVAARREAGLSDLREERVQETVKKKGGAFGSASAR